MRTESPRSFHPRAPCVTRACRFILRLMRTHSSLEPLEARVAPAGLIVASVVNGVLQLKSVVGQDGDERITISSNPDGTYLLTPETGVTLRVGGTDFTTPQSIDGVTKGLSVNFGSGSDHLTLDEVRFTG